MHGLWELVLNMTLFEKTTRIVAEKSSSINQIVNKLGGEIDGANCVHFIDAIMALVLSDESIEDKMLHTMSMCNSDKYAAVVDILHRGKFSPDFGFMRKLLDTAEDIFDCLKGCYSSDGEKRLFALVSFIGHLYIRNLLSENVITQMMEDLRMFDSCGVLKCFCELLHIVGNKLDSSEEGMQHISEGLVHLSRIASRPENEDGTHMDAVSYVYQVRYLGWPPRLLIPVQCFVIATEEARSLWLEMQEDMELPFELLAEDFHRMENDTRCMKFQRVDTQKCIAISSSNVQDLEKYVAAFAGLQAQTLDMFGDLHAI
jgi:hypothetical protein